ncbi:MAG: ATP-binding cassette domain-containing protein [Endomicrobium sp.]|jgi:ATPase subunit of ABC transporter with duplicated ATPase domains|nr:ATP-binding cassette domain-containing protein [Endomicrobium sp.]
MLKPIFLNHISLYFPNKVCFEDFSAQIHSDSRIAVIGNNGSGKSSLLEIIKGDLMASEGEVQNNKNVSFGYVPQLIYDYENLSGGEKFNKALSAAFSYHPDVLLLDEPTNHLDLKNRKSLIKMLNFYKGILIIVSHDIELLRRSINILWHIDYGTIHIFNGKYDDYRQSILQKRQVVEYELNLLAKEKKENHKSLMREQQRAKKSRQRGEKFVEQKKWLPAVGDLKESSAKKNAGRNQKIIADKREMLAEQLSNFRLPEIIKPTFSLTAKDIDSRTIVSISSGGVGYKNKMILKDINLSVSGNDRLAITGDNGSGKTTLLKGILNCPQIVKTGIWDVPDAKNIGYLDQYYSSLDDTKTVLETLTDIFSEKTYAEIRNFLNDFLFKKNEEVNKQASVLSGGEKVRLCLAKIAAQMFKLLLIDEITNNIDLETKEHITQILKEYPGAVIIISHDKTFLENVGITHYYAL